MRHHNTRPARRHAQLAAAIFATALAALAIAPGCSLIEAQQSCEDACAELDRCGLVSIGSCGAYCTGMVAGVAIAGCDDEFDAQNECAKSSNDCSSGAAQCVDEVEAFGKCMEAYCEKNPTGQGCPG